jgi:hypothetical protein
MRRGNALLSIAHALKQRERELDNPPRGVRSRATAAPHLESNAEQDAAATMLIDLAFAELIFSTPSSRSTPAMPCSVEGVVDRDTR